MFCFARLTCILDHRLLAELTDVSFNVRELHFGSIQRVNGEALLIATGSVPDGYQRTRGNNTPRKHTNGTCSFCSLYMAVLDLRPCCALRVCVPNIWSLIDSVLSMALRVDLDNSLVGFCSAWCFDDLNPVSQGGAHRLIGFARKKAMNNHWNTVHHGDIKQPHKQELYVFDLGRDLS